MTRHTAEQRRSALLQAAQELFSTQGYEGTTTRSVAERTGVTEAMVFRHFPTKHDLFLAVVAELGPRHIFTTTYENLRELPVREALATVLTDYLDTFWRNRAYLRMMVLETWRDPAAFRELQTQFNERGHLLLMMLERRIARGELREGTAVATADTLSAALTGFLFRCLRTEPKDWQIARTAFLNHLLDTLLPGIASHAPAGERL